MPPIANRMRLELLPWRRFRFKSLCTKYDFFLGNWLEPHAANAQLISARNAKVERFRVLSGANYEALEFAQSAKSVHRASCYWRVPRLRAKTSLPFEASLQNKSTIMMSSAEIKFFAFSFVAFSQKKRRIFATNDQKCINMRKSKRNQEVQFCFRVTLDSRPLQSVWFWLLIGLEVDRTSMVKRCR